ncbi:MAG TPA: P-type conjugative transfer protein TrbJ [Sphingomonadaceae bacterium]|nr:P-type conjugative transfer protein TrbJ [Sphingomonadaceae bacterium]
MRILGRAMALTVTLAAPAGCVVALCAAPASAALPVFDSTNYAQNILQAARALEQINNQIRSLQNEAAMIQNMSRNLERIDFPQLGRVKEALQKIDRLMGQGRGVDVRVDQLDQRLRTLFPGAVDHAARTDRRLADARARLEGAMDGFRHGMRVQAQVVENVREDAELLADMVARSQDAVGSLQAAQATNQLLALSTKQQLQLQSLMAAEFQSLGLERARRGQAESEARAAARRFLGTGRAYTPR